MNLVRHMVFIAEGECRPPGIGVAKSDVDLGATMVARSRTASRHSAVCCVRKTYKKKFLSLVIKPRRGRPGPPFGGQPKSSGLHHPFSTSGEHL